MFLNARNARYYVEICGTGEPLLFLHGFTGDHSTWNAVADALKENYQVITLDILGHGRSDCPSDAARYAMEEVCADIAVILDQLSVGKVHVIGYSMGGRLALSFAILYSEYVKSANLESASPGLATADEREKRRMNDRHLANEIEQNGLEAFVDHWENIPLFASQRNLPAEERLAIRKQRLSNSTIGLGNSLRGMGTGMQPSWWEALEQIDKPVLLLSGELDLKFREISKRMHERLPNSEQKVILGVGHAIHVENSAIFGKIVSEFVEKWRG
ncbi:2-succinyl-6-hydroxy-2,4-cyclohexadiene-1-carboxylate synthase [Bacillus testis]|uniref:2-succinyl-6-hydroxy-2, 4-cyclohexadiene-1-carboxylate synthase n=1 Tax=Bacillus testis TaxID=1622072 RepID=UPI00067F53F0|nr:2-succinyl-6-hydroxy-2,4-cyclohexadiene-1-carboxylate synthase [Bacillus testis]